MAAINPAVSVATAESRLPNVATFWRLTVDGLVASRLPGRLIPLSGCSEVRCSPLLRILLMKDKAANGAAT